MDTRTEALTEIVRLARINGLSADDVAAAVRGAGGEIAAPEAGGRGRTVLVRVLGFLGGTFIFAGIGIFIALQWDGMNSGQRVVVTLGTGLGAFVLGAVARRDRRVERAATPLYLVAALLEPIGMLVAFEEFGSGGDWRWASLATAGTVAVQYAFAFAVAKRSMLLFVAVSYAVVALWTALDLVGLDDNLIAMTVGASLMLAAVWADRSSRADITPLWYFIGAAASLGGLFDMVESSPLELAFVAAAAGFVYLSVLLRSRTLLVVATLAILAYTGWFTSEHFADSIGWPLALVGFGLFMIGLSALAVRIDRQYVRQ
jgi:hypothetical protein